MSEFDFRKLMGKDAKVSDADIAGEVGREIADHILVTQKAGDEIVLAMARSAAEHDLSLIALLGFVISRIHGATAQIDKKQASGLAKSLMELLRILES